MSRSPIEDLARDLASVTGSGSLRRDEADRWTYGYDNSRRQTLPGLVVVPDEAAQVQEIVRAAFRHRVPLTVRGRGTGTAGAAVPSAGGLVLSTENLDRILRIDADNRVAVVEPGVVNGALQRAAAEQGFFWPPDPTSADYCTVGGNLACNAAGPRAVKYGTPRENTLGLVAITGDGRRLRTGCYTTKGVVGYDLTRLIIGSEGSLAVIVEATLKLTPSPAAVATARAVYDDMATAAAAVAAIMSQPVIPRALEFMDGSSIALAREHGGADLPADAGALLIIEIDGLEAAIEPGLDALAAAAANDGLVDFARARDEASAGRLWACRKALSPALRRVARGKINEDVVVPVSRMAELVARLERLSEAHGVRIVSFGHAGNGNIHVNLLGDTGDPDELARMHRCLEQVFQAVLELGGTLSGEHGIGLEKRAWVGLEIEPETLELMRRIKRQFDPGGILNPGKLFPDETEASQVPAT